MTPPRAARNLPLMPATSTLTSSTDISFNSTTLQSKMTLVESVKSTIGLGDGTATRQEMSDARLPLAYRDSCAHLLIPLNRCRQDEYYLPWKCEVGDPETIHFRLRVGRDIRSQDRMLTYNTIITDRASHLREVPV